MIELMSLRVPGTPEYIKITEMAVAGVAALAGFDVDAVEDIKMATGEACKHITCHEFAAHNLPSTPTSTDGWHPSLHFEGCSSLECHLRA